MRTFRPKIKPVSTITYRTHHWSSSKKTSCGEPIWPSSAWILKSRSDFTVRFMISPRLRFIVIRVAKRDVKYGVLRHFRPVVILVVRFLGYAKPVADGDHVDVASSLEIQDRLPARHARVQVDFGTGDGQAVQA